jgi:hypothetical protein
MHDSLLSATPKESAAYSPPLSLDPNPRRHGLHLELPGRGARCHDGRRAPWRQRVSRGAPPRRWCRQGRPSSATAAAARATAASARAVATGTRAASARSRAPTAAARAAAAAARASAASSRSARRAVAVLRGALTSN